MKLKLSLKNSIKFVLPLLNLLILFISGCSCPVEPTYKEKDIPRIIKEICKKEYNLDVTTQRTKTTLWIYAPLDKLMHKEFGTKEDKYFDDTVMDKAMNINITIGRVLLSSDYTPDFFVLIFSDIKLGIDYTMTGNVLDMKKLYAGYIPEEEARRRYVMSFKASPEAIGDTTGFHFMPYDITISEFLKDQIAQRIAVYFQSDELKNYYKVNQSEGEFKDGVFLFRYSIEEVTKPKRKIKVRNEILDIIAYTLRTYEFNDFSVVSITDLRNDERLNYTKKEILERPIDF
jgi:hypothetical protein